VTGSPLVTAVTDYRGQFTITNLPAGANIPLVIQNGRWRRQFTIPNVPACVNTALPSTGVAQLRMPRSHTEGNIPRTAFVTGSLDALECLLRKIGIADTEFSNPFGTGRVQFYLGDGSPGAMIDANTPGEAQLWSNQSILDSYDMVYFDCQGAEYLRTVAAQNAIISYANSGGRVFVTHYAYVWLFDDLPFSMTANWMVDQIPNFTTDPQTAFIDMGFARGQTLAQWLQLLGATTTLGQIAIGTLRDDFTGVIAPAQAWLSLNDPLYPPMKPMQYTFDTPVGFPAGSQCGRVLFADWHVENATNTTGMTFPSECTAGPMTPEEQMVEYMIFDLGAYVHP
jgi:hypothetical protein